MDPRMADELVWVDLGCGNRGDLDGGARYRMIWDKRIFSMFIDRERKYRAEGSKKRRWGFVTLNF